jgi:epoxyqueuosine reductase
MMNRQQSSPIASEEIVHQLETVGFRASFMSFSNLTKIPKLHEAYLGVCQNKESASPGRLPLPPDVGFEPRSLLIVAFADSGGGLALDYNGKRITIPIPPEFLNGSVRQRLRDTLKEITAGYQWVGTKGIPLKLLANSCGLGKYGHNTLCYVDKFGSYCSLEAYYTDIPCEDKDCATATMTTCETCGRCSKNCATGALSGRVVDASRCLYAQNMRNQPMPDWLSPKVHHTLIGCIRCQEICPVNKLTPAAMEKDLELNQAETESLLSLPSEELPPELVQKMLNYGILPRLIPVAGRNAKLVIEARGSQ